MFCITYFSHINMPPHQTPGISNQALVFMTDVKMFAQRTDILVKSAIFNSNPAGKWFGPIMLYLETFWKPKFSTIWNRFHGGTRPSYELFVIVMYGQNGNTELITLSMSV